MIRPPLPNASFTMVRNCWARDRRISLKAKGLLTYLLSHAEGYRCSQAQMVRESDDGKDAVRTALSELERAGYLTRVRDQRAARGRFAEDDYTLSDPFDAAGHLIEREPRLPFAEDGRETRQSGFTAADQPPRGTRPIEEHQGEEPTPTGLGAAGLRVVEEHERALTAAQALAAEHYEATGKLGGNRSFLAARGIITAALEVGHTPEQIRPALESLRRRGRPLTNSTLGPLLADPRLAAGAPPSGNGHAPYRDPASPDAYAGQF